MTSSELVRWKGSSGIVSLGKPPAGFNDCDTTAGGVSPDGSVIVGACSTTVAIPGGMSSKRVAFRWTEATGIVLLGTLPARSQSDWVASTADGAVVVGMSFETSEFGATAEAFRWTATSGIVGLGFLPGDDTSFLSATNPDTRRFTLSADGKVVVGSSQTGKLQHAFRWTEGSGIASLQPLAGDDGAWVETISADGKVVVGSSLQGTQGRAVWWDQAGAAHSFSADLTTAGIDLAGFQPIDARFVSGGNKRMVAGDGYTGDNGVRTWVARLP